MKQHHIIAITILTPFAVACGGPTSPLANPSLGARDIAVVSVGDRDGGPRAEPAVPMRGSDKGVVTPTAPATPSAECRTDSDCGAGQACRFFIDYGDCPYCDGGRIASACQDAGAVQCPSSMSCEPGVDNPRCTDPRFKQRCPHTERVL